MEIRQHLQQELRRLKMPGLVEALDLRLAEAREHTPGIRELFASSIALETLPHSS